MRLLLHLLWRLTGERPIAGGNLVAVGGEARPWGDPTCYFVTRVVDGQPWGRPTGAVETDAAVREVALDLVSQASGRITPAQEQAMVQQLMRGFQVSEQTASAAVDRAMRTIPASS